MRSIGRGRKAADILSAHLGLPPPVWSSAWAEHTRVLDNVAGEALRIELKESTRRLKEAQVKKILIGNWEGNWEGNMKV